VSFEAERHLERRTSAISSRETIRRQEGRRDGTKIAMIIRRKTRWWLGLKALGDERVVLGQSRFDSETKDFSDGLWSRMIYLSDGRADIPVLVFFDSVVARTSGGSARKQSYEPLLLENEREAVSELLHHLESESKVEEQPACKHPILTWLPPQPPPDRTTTNFFTGSPLASLTTLSFSDNVDLQRSAALAFAEITEKEVREVGRDTLDPVLFLLGSHDTEVQRAASAALGNLAVNRESTSFISFRK
jgi:hypothetical protein